jgi:hypothetical protein
MRIDVGDGNVQDACFLVLRLLTRRCKREEADRIHKEVLVAATGYMARPSVPRSDKKADVKKGKLMSMIDSSNGIN